MSPPRKIWTEERYDQLRRMLAAGETVEAIAAAFGIAPATVRWHCAAKGIPTGSKPAPWTEEKIAAARRMAGEGRTRGEIANALGSTEAKVGEICRVHRIVTVRATPSAAPPAGRVTDAVIEEVRRRRAAGESMTEIAIALGRTRNSVIGICNRAGIGRGEARKSSAPAATRPAPPVKARPIRARPAPLVALVVRDLPAGPVTQPAPAPPAGGVPILEARPDQCRFPLWPHHVVRPRADAARVCGGPAAIGRSWCAHHAKLVYAPPPARPVTKPEEARHGRVRAA